MRPETMMLMVKSDEGKWPKLVICAYLKCFGKKKVASLRKRSGVSSVSNFPFTA